MIVQPTRTQLARFEKSFHVQRCRDYELCIKFLTSQTHVKMYVKRKKP
jgi:hypothetical protein